MHGISSRRYHQLPERGGIRQCAAGAGGAAASGGAVRGGGGRGCMVGMDFGLSAVQETIRRAARAVAGGFSLDYWLECDRDERYPWEFVRAFAAAGWLGVLIPEEYG